MHMARNADLLAWTQKTMLRSRIKRTSAVAFFNGIGTVAQISGSYLYPDESAPRSVLAMTTNSGFDFVAIRLALVLRNILLRGKQELADHDNEVEANTLMVEGAQGTRNRFKEFRMRSAVPERRISVTSHKSSVG